MKYTVIDIAYYLIMNHASTIHRNRLQIFCYLIYGWYLKFYNDSADDLKNKLFENDYTAWQFFPVSETLRKALMNTNGYFSFIKKKNFRNIKGIKDIEEQCIKDLIKDIFSIYNCFDTPSLEIVIGLDRAYAKARKGISEFDNGTELLSDYEIYINYDTVLKACEGK